MRSISSLPLLPDPLWPGVAAPDMFLSMGQRELNCVITLNWIVWSRTVFDILNCVLMLNWIVWSRIVQTFNCNITDGHCRWECASTSVVISQWKYHEPSVCGQNDLQNSGVILIWPFTCFTIVFTSVTEHSGTFKLFQKNLYIRN